MIYKKLYVLPILVSTGFLVGFLLFYIVALETGRVNALLPYISDTASTAPESCFFGEAISAGSFFLALIIHLRYIQVRDLEDLSLCAKVLNLIALIFGWLASFGISIVGNFQLKNMPEVHLLGGVMGFGFGSLYQLVMWKITFKLRYIIKIPEWLHPCKLILGITSFCTFLCMYTFSAISITFYHGKDIAKWSDGDGGYDYHLVSTINEWVCAFTTMIYLLSFAADFWYFKLEEFRVYQVEDV